MNCDHVYKLSPGPLEYSNTADITASEPLLCQKTNGELGYSQDNI